MNGKQIVETGYDVLAEAYLHVRRLDGEDVRLLDALTSRLPAGARVLDAGCGAGVPVAQLLSKQFRVTGVDISASQISLARQAIPNATFLQADMTTLTFPADSFDAVVSYYAIIHIPREEHPALFASFRRMLSTGGLLLVSMGASDNPHGIEEDWLGGGAAMYWSHYNHADNLHLVTDAGFDILRSDLIAEDECFGGGTHLFILARAV